MKGGVFLISVNMRACGGSQVGEEILNLKETDGAALETGE